MAALKKDYPGASFKDVNSVQKFFYEIDVVIDGKAHEMKVDAAGDIGDEHGGEGEDDEHGKGEDREKGEKRETRARRGCQGLIAPGHSGRTSPVERPRGARRALHSRFDRPAPSREPTHMPPSPSTTLSKLPAITLAFWIMKISATTLGETLGDFLSKGPEHGGINLGYALASVIVLAIFLVTLLAQLSVTRFIPFLYWAVILSTSTAGTTMSDFMDRTLGLGYARGSAILIALLIGALVVWRLVEGTISVSSVRTRRAEVFYWFAILCSNTLGTALGDYLADEEQGPGLGFMGGAAIIGGVIALIAGVYFVARRARVSSPTLYVGLFWLAFVLTRPFGATFGDVLARPTLEGGVGFGPAGSSAALLAILIGVILWTVRHDARAPKGTEVSGAP